MAPHTLCNGREGIKDRLVPGSPQLFFSALRSCAPLSVYQAVLDALVEIRRLYRSRDHVGAIEVQSCVDINSRDCIIYYLTLYLLI